MFYPPPEPTGHSNQDTECLHMTQELGEDVIVATLNKDPEADSLWRVWIELDGTNLDLCHPIYQGHLVQKATCGQK